MIRAFIAITLPAALQQEIERVQDDMRRQMPGWRWVKPANVHLTLKFLGEMPLDRVESIVRAMERGVAGQKIFPLYARSLGCFPDLTRPRILWMGLDDPHQALGPLHARLEAALAEQGCPPEKRPFRPHLTIARAQANGDRGRLGMLLRTYHAEQFGAISVACMRLVQSQLHRDGAVYTNLQSVAFREQSDTP